MQYFLGPFCFLSGPPFIGHIFSLHSLSRAIACTLPGVVNLFGKQAKSLAPKSPPIKLLLAKFNWPQ